MSAGPPYSDDLAALWGPARPRDRPVRELGAPEPEPSPVPSGENDFAIDVQTALDRKIAALVGHRSQYASDTDLRAHQVLGPLLCTEHFTLVR